MIEGKVGERKGKRAAKPSTTVGVCLGGYGQEVEFVNGAVEVLCFDCGAYSLAMDMVDHVLKNRNIVSACHP